MTSKQICDTRILIVDDEPDLRSILAFSFKKKGYQVLEAANGKEAFDLIQANPVDVVLSDARMPGGDGIELLDKVRKEHHGIPIIILVTGFTDLSTEDAHNKGAEALFSKPFDRKELEGAIERLLTPCEERWAKISNQVNIELKVELKFQGLSEAIEASEVNLGRGGMFVTLHQGEYPNVNDMVAFKVTFNGTGNTLSGTGIIRWMRVKSSPDFPTGCGIEFTYLGESERKQVMDFVALKKPKSYIPSK